MRRRILAVCVACVIAGAVAASAQEQKQETAPAPGPEVIHLTGERVYTLTAVNEWEVSAVIEQKIVFKDGLPESLLDGFKKHKLPERLETVREVGRPTPEGTAGYYDWPGAADKRDEIRFVEIAYFDDAERKAWEVLLTVTVWPRETMIPKGEELAKRSFGPLALTLDRRGLAITSDATWDGVRLTNRCESSTVETSVWFNGLLDRASSAQLLAENERIVAEGNEDPLIERLLQIKHSNFPNVPPGQRRQSQVLSFSQETRDDQRIPFTISTRGSLRSVLGDKTRQAVKEPSWPIVITTAMNIDRKGQQFERLVYRPVRFVLSQR